MQLCAEGVTPSNKEGDLALLGVVFDFECQICGISYRVKARRNDRSWGHAVEVELFSMSGESVNRLSFACHPEFPGFSEWQTKSTEELMEYVRDRLADRSLVPLLEEARGAGLHLCQRFNSPSLDHSAWFVRNDL